MSILFFRNHDISCFFMQLSGVSLTSSWFNLFLIHFTNLDAAVALRWTLANDLHRRVFWSHHVRHRVVNTYFRLVRTRSTEFYLAAADRNEIPRHCALAKIPFRRPRLAGAWLNWRSVAGIRSSLQRIEFLSQLSTQSLLSARLRTRDPRKFHGNRLNAAAAFNRKGNAKEGKSECPRTTFEIQRNTACISKQNFSYKNEGSCHSSISCLECGIISWDVDFNKI